MRHVPGDTLPYIRRRPPTTSQRALGRCVRPAQDTYTGCPATFRDVDFTLRSNVQVSVRSALVRDTSARQLTADGALGGPSLNQGDQCGHSLPDTDRCARHRATLARRGRRQPARECGGRGNDQWRRDHGRVLHAARPVFGRRRAAGARRGHLVDSLTGDPVASATTDEAGAYVISGLDLGDYQVAATARETPAPTGMAAGSATATSQPS